MDWAASATAAAATGGPETWSAAVALEPSGAGAGAARYAPVCFSFFGGTGDGADFETDPKGTAVEAAGSIANAVLARNGAGV